MSDPKNGKADPVVADEEEAIAAENHKIAAEHKAESEGEAEKAKKALRELKRSDT